MTLNEVSEAFLETNQMSGLLTPMATLQLMLPLRSIAKVGRATNLNLCCVDF